VPNYEAIPVQWQWNYVKSSIGKPESQQRYPHSVGQVEIPSRQLHWSSFGQCWHSHVPAVGEFFLYWHGRILARCRQCVNKKESASDENFGAKKFHEVLSDSVWRFSAQKTLQGEKFLTPNFFI